MNQFVFAILKKINPSELAGGGPAVEEVAEGGDGEPKEAPIVEDTTIFVEDRPISPRAWQSETAEETAAVVSAMAVSNRDRRGQAYREPVLNAYHTKFPTTAKLPNCKLQCDCAILYS